MLQAYGFYFKEYIDRRYLYAVKRHCPYNDDFVALHWLIWWVRNKSKFNRCLLKAEWVVLIAGSILEAFLIKIGGQRVVSRVALVVRCYSLLFRGFGWMFMQFINETGCIVEDIKALTSGRKFSFCFIPRSGNSVACTLWSFCWRRQNLRFLVFRMILIFCH